MVKAKYSDLVQPLRLWTEIVRPSYRGKMADFSLLFDEKVQPKTKCWVEIFYAYAPGAGNMDYQDNCQSYLGKEKKSQEITQQSHNNSMSCSCSSALIHLTIPALA